MISCAWCSGRTAEDIVNQLVHNTQLQQELKYHKNYEFTNDMLQDIWLYMLERSVKDKKYEQHLIEVCQANKMNNHLASIINNQVYSTSSDTAKLYINKPGFRTHSKTYFSYEEIQSFLGNDIIQDKKIDIDKFNRQVALELTKLDFYDRELFVMVVASGKSYEELSKQIHIEAYNIGNTFRKVRELLKNKLKKFNFELDN